jgi:hypothetical protein
VPMKDSSRAAGLATGAAGPLSALSSHPAWRSHSPTPFKRMGDLLHQLYNSCGLRVLLSLAGVVATIWLIAHRMAPPCERISIVLA